MRLRRRLRTLFVGLILFAAVAPVAPQDTGFRVLEAAPTGEIQTLQDANEVRMVFSEPMVALGRVPSNPVPAWVHISPALAGDFRWSGTTILIFTPDPKSPPPYATRFTVTIDRTAESAAGHALGRSYQFAFTTPTVRLLASRWARQSARFDSPVALALEFNQPVRAADILAHVAVRAEPHDWTPPEFSQAERGRLQATDPAGLRRFDQKVAATTAAARSNAPVPMRVALNWDRERFIPADTLVVLETVTPPPPETWLAVVLDGRVPSPAGSAVPGSDQTSTHELDHAFFVEGPSCRDACAPSRFNGIEFSRPVAVQAFASALTIRDVTDAGHEQPIAATTAVKSGGPLDDRDEHGVEDAGFANQPAAHTWALHLDASLAANDGQVLGYPWLGVVENWHDVAFSSFGDGHGVWETGGGPVLPFSARNLESVTEWMAPIAPADLMPRMLALQKDEFTTPPPGPGTVRKLGVTPDAVTSHGFDLSGVLSARHTGLVWAAVEDGSPIAMSKAASEVKPHATLVQVTNLGITVKDSPQSTLVFVTRLDNGQPVADARVTIVTRDNKAVWNGRTARDGVAMAPALPLRSASGLTADGEYSDLQYLVTATKDDDVAYVVSDWDEGIEPWSFGLNYGLWEAKPVLRGSVFSDRGVYRPGEDVHLKAILRSDTATGMDLLPAGASIDVSVHDSRDHEVDHRSLRVNRWSSAEWTWTVPPAGVVGTYAVAITLASAKSAPVSSDASHADQNDAAWLHRIDGSFLVAAYRRPDFRVDATVAADPPVAGSPLHATLDAKYLFGTAMAGRPVRWTLTRDLDLSLPDEVTTAPAWKDFQFGYDPETTRKTDDRAAAEDATLDASGHLAMDLPTEKNVDLAFRYTFEGDVEDVSRQHIANRADIVVYPAPWFIGLRQPTTFADPKTGTSVDVAVVGRDGHAVTGIPVTVSLVRVQWNSVRHAEGHGFYTWDTQRLESAAGEWHVTSAAAPVTQALPVPEGGFYIVRAVAHDDAGHLTRTESSFYGVGDGYTAWERFDNNRIRLEADRGSYRPGDTARVMIQSPWANATALLTIEREGIRQHRQFALTSTQQTVDVPISPADIPNVYVSVLLVRGRSSNDVGPDGDDPGKPQFRLGYAELKVEDASKKLGVRVTADRTDYRPTTPARIAVTVNDPTGRGARSEVTLWAVDYGVLSLTGYEAPDLLHAVWMPKSLEVTTVDSRQRIVSRRVLTPKGETDGGGGGRENGPSSTRQDFRPLAFWLGSIETDGNGRASTTVTLPDSLTTYRIMAVAGDAQSRFGSASAEIQVSKPVTIVPGLPRFLTTGDRGLLGAVVTNTTKAGGAATITARSLDPGVLDLEGGAQTITLGPGASSAVRFTGTARVTGSARVEMRVTLGADGDAFQTTVPVIAPSPVETTAAFGETDSRTTQPIAIPTHVLSNTGGLQIDLSSTALVNLGEGVRYLSEYGFDCAEQKASRALGLLLAADLGSAFSMSRITPAEYRARATAALAELPADQCSDGGFAFWPGACLTENAYLTAYVLDAMKASADLGVTPAPSVVNDALAYLEHAVVLPEPRPLTIQATPAYGASLAYVVKILTLYGHHEDSALTRLSTLVDRLPIFALSNYADALASSGDRGPRYQDAIRRLTNALRVEGDQAHAEEPDDDTLAWLWDSNVRATAIVLDGFVRRGDDPIFVARMVRWLLAARQNGRWDNTQENVMALRALVAYYKTYESTPPDMVARVSLGSSVIGTATFKGRSTIAQSVHLSMSDLLAQLSPVAGQTSDLAVERTGTGHIYYTARLQAASSDVPPASDHGITVERRYERVAQSGDSPASTSFAAGDLVRVTLTVTVPTERRFVAVTDPLPAGFEPVDAWFRTTAADLARDASTFGEEDTPTGWLDWWRHGGFDNVEKYDDRVVAFGTRLGAGRHEFSYVVRATTAGTFMAAGASAEEMYAPEVNGRAAPATVIVR